MVAVTVVGIAMATVLQSISYALVTARVTKDYLFANALLSEKFWELTSVGSAEPGMKEGTFPDHPEFRYRVTAEDLFAGQSARNAGVRSSSLAKITVTLYWNFRGKIKRLSAQTFLPIPAEEQPFSAARLFS